MSSSRFITPFDRLPDTLPIFPLPGALVMPGSDLPLNIFEPRYLNMVEDALSSHRLLGMIQPVDDGEDATPALHKTGCAGRITRYAETRDGRIELILSGVCRFDLGPEFPTTRGYRMISPVWAPYRADYDPPTEPNESEQQYTRQVLRRYFQHHELEMDWDILDRTPLIRLMHSLLSALPISVAHKQDLLEVPDPLERLRLFVTLMETSLMDRRQTH